MSHASTKEERAQVESLLDEPIPTGDDLTADGWDDDAWDQFDGLMRRAGRA